MIKHIKSWQTELEALTDNSIIAPFYGYIKEKAAEVYSNARYTKGTKLTLVKSGSGYTATEKRAFTLGQSKLGIDKL